MLIINADDLGRSVAATDAIMECFRKHRITSTSAMVFMADSERAARQALDCGMDAGLHLNFSESFTGANVPSGLRDDLRWVSATLKACRLATIPYYPWLRGRFQRLFVAQLAEFRRLYGGEPSHFDGHQHMHHAANVRCQRLIPEGARVRRNFTFAPGEKGALNRWYRSHVDRCLARRHRLTAAFYSLAPNLGFIPLRRIADQARAQLVELMAHPALNEEFEFLISDSFVQATEGVWLGAHREL